MHAQKIQALVSIIQNAEKGVLESRFEELTKLLERQRSVQFYTDLSIKQATNEMIEIRAKLDSLNAFVGNKE